MNVDWDFTAEAFLDQLSSHERAKVVHAVQRLSGAPDGRHESHLKKLAGAQNDLYSLQVGGDLRVLLSKRNDIITVVDIVQQRQVEGLRRLRKQGQSAAE